MNRLTLIFVCFALLLPFAAAQELVGLRPDAPTYALHGPYTVGAIDYMIGAGEDTVTVTVWYPAINPDNLAEDITYTITDAHPDFPGMPVTGHAIRDATVDHTGGPYPLVVYAPGVVCWRQFSVFMPEHWASHGMVSIAFDPRGETFASYWEGAFTRPLDMQRVMDFADSLNTAGDFTGLIDMERIAIAGHSSGGWSALVGGGARYDFSWCEANPDLVALFGLSNCHQWVDHQDDIAVQLGLSEAPEGLWPAWFDEQVDAIIAMSPDGDIWGADYAGLANVNVPALVMYGSEDGEVYPHYVYENLGSSKKSQIIFEGADHMIFANTCEASPWFAEVDYWVCSDAVWDMNRAHDLINHFSTAFLLAELNADSEAKAALSVDSMDFHGIRYDTTTY